jgi:hypothetical protein
MKKVFLSCLILMFLITLVSAEVQTLPPVKQGTCILLVQSHPNATLINVTAIRYPDGTEDSISRAMTTTNGINFRYSFCNTSQIGSYIVNTCGNGDGVFDCPPPYNFEVTWTGLTESQERSRLFWMYGAAILLYVIFTAIAWKVELTWLGFLAAMLMILPGMNMMIHGFGFEDQLLIRGIAMVLIVIGILTMVIFAFEYNHLFGESGFFGQEANSEKEKDEHDYFEKSED